MDLQEIRKWHSVFKPNNELFEIRILGRTKYDTHSGYFNDVEEAIKLITQFDHFQLYFTVNEVHPACSGRVQYNTLIKTMDASTSKNDIIRRLWLPIDIDVKRPTAISASQEEKEYAHQKAREVVKFLKEAGFYSPVICDSSSGYHIYYPIDTPADDNTENSVKKFYEVLGEYYTDDKVKIDSAVGDANRIMRLYGTWGRKGRNSEERPHRLSKILYAPQEIKRMGIEQIDSFNSKYEIIHENPNPKRKQQLKNEHTEEFDIRKFIAEHNIQIAKETPYGGGGTKFVLEECPFCSNHKAPDSAIFLSADGKLGFKCFHDSDSDKDWRAFRLHFDPHAYDNEDMPQNNFYQQQMVYLPPRKKETYQIKEESEEIGKKWLSMSNIKKIDLTNLFCIKTGFFELDKKIVGLYEGEITILSGSNSSGKSSWINSLILNVINQGNKVALWSGELPPEMLKAWILQCAAGKDFIHPSKFDKDKFYVPQEISDKIDSWMEGKFFLYNNDYSNKFQQIFNDMEEMVAMGVKLIILDNLFSLDIEMFEGDKNNKQKELILKLSDFVKRERIHLMLVAHPRKVTTFLRKNDISGTSDLGNAASNIFICHRVNQDFIRSGYDFYGDAIKRYETYGNCIEVCKNRLYGIVDCLFGMHYEVSTRRFKNTEEENIHYGWEEQPQEQTFESLNTSASFTSDEFDNPFEGEELEDLPF